MFDVLCNVLYVLVNSFGLKLVCPKFLFENFS